MASSIRPCITFIRVARQRPMVFGRQQTAYLPNRSLHLTPLAHAPGDNESLPPKRSTPSTPEESNENLGLDYLDSLAQGMGWEPRVGFDDGKLDEREPKPDRPPNGFFAEGEEDSDPGDDPEFEPDDISSLAHGELEQVRELRELERVIAWDMPLLYRHAQPFTPPTAAQPLRWRYTTFLGEAHPAARKVVLTFSPGALPGLTPAQATKLKKLLGARLDPRTGVARLSGEQHATAAQNKAALGELLERLLAAARDPADSFADIPLDTRHARPRRAPRQLAFPRAWRLTPARQEQLAAGRAARAEREAAAVQAGAVVEGARMLGAPPGTEEVFVPRRPRYKRR